MQCPYMKGGFIAPSAINGEGANGQRKEGAMTIVHWHGCGLKDSLKRNTQSSDNKLIFKVYSQYYY